MVQDKDWWMCLGPIELPEMELDAAPLGFDPGQWHYGYDAAAFKVLYSDGSEGVEFCAKTEDGQWLSVLPPGHDQLPSPTSPEAGSTAAGCAAATTKGA